MNKLFAVSWIASFLAGTALAQSEPGEMKLPERGMIQEVWEGVRGGSLDNLRDANAYKKGEPSYARIIDNLDIGQMGDEFGARYTALLEVPETGDYTFWLAADDAAALYLSNDESPEKARVVAELKTYTNRKSFSGRGKSAPIILEKGKKYYLMLLHKEGGGDDHLAVAWSGPNRERSILTAQNLSPVVSPEQKKALDKTFVAEQKQKMMLDKLKATAPGSVPEFLNSLSPADVKLLARYFTQETDRIKEMPDAEAILKLAPYVKMAQKMVATPEQPLKNAAARQLLHLEEAYLKRLSFNELKKLGPHRLASSLGALPAKVKGGTGKVLLVSHEGKHRNELVSTGFYALPGKAFTVKLPQEMEKLGFTIQIGHHIVPNDRQDLVSMPDTTRRYPLNQQKSEFISPHGGLVFIEVPAATGLDKYKEPVEFSGVIQAPRFVLGKTTNEQWKSIRAYPAPWGELVSEHLTMVVPRDALLKLDNPEELMAWWNENNRRHEDFYAYYPGVAFRMHAALYAREGISYWPLEWRPENIVDLLDIDKMHKYNSALYLHEHGHHADFGDMEFGYIAESTPNWAGYYMKAAIPFEWKDDPTVHLTKLMNPEDKQHNEIKQADWYKISTKGTHHWSYPVTSMMLGYTEDFGWEPFKKTIHRLRDREDPMYSWPFTSKRSDDQAKIDRYLIGLSEEAGRDVRPYFAHFYLLPSEGAAAYLDNLALAKWDATHLPPPAVATTGKNESLTIPQPEKTVLSMAGAVTLKWLKPEKGEIKVTDTGDAVYTPEKDYTGAVKLPYTVTTPVGASPVKYLTITVGQ